MAIIEGQIDSLKQLKQTLLQNGITRFKSISEINNFIKHYKDEKNNIPKAVEQCFCNKLEKTKTKLINLQKDYEYVKNKAIQNIQQQINTIQIKIKVLKIKSTTSVFCKLRYYVKIKRLQSKKNNLEKNFNSIIYQKTIEEENKVNKVKKQLNDYTINKDIYITERVVKETKELERIKKILDSLYPLITGAIGEYAVVKEIEKLPNSFILFNDFAVTFSQPIYNKTEDDYIYSIQIDHLLVCEAGVFILETKNWSERSVNNAYLRSPVKQIHRSSYALFTLLNNNFNKRFGLTNHHWGSRKIPIKKIIVMTKKKPISEFKYVKVLLLKNLNSYLQQFEPIFTKEEVTNICKGLRYLLS